FYNFFKKVGVAFVLFDYIICTIIFKTRNFRYIITGIIIIRCFCFYSNNIVFIIIIKAGSFKLLLGAIFKSNCRKVVLGGNKCCKKNKYQKDWEFHVFFFSFSSQRYYF